MQSRRSCLLRRVEVKVGGRKVWLEQLDGFVVDLLLGEVHERRQEADVAHHLDSFLVGALQHLHALHVVPRHRLDRLVPAVQVHAIMLWAATGAPTHWKHR